MSRSQDLGQFGDLTQVEVSLARRRRSGEFKVCPRPDEKEKMTLEKCAHAPARCANEVRR